MKRDKDYKENYADFWKDIVETNGVLDLDKVQRELSDFHFLMEEALKVYMEVSGGMISKTNTYAFEVLNLFEEKFEDKEITKDHIESILEEEISAEDKLEEIKNYFGIHLTTLDKQLPDIEAFFTGLTNEK